MAENGVPVLRGNGAIWRDGKRISLLHQPEVGGGKWGQMNYLRGVEE